MSKNKIKFSSERRVIEPGGFYFGDDVDEIYTLLGSCVAVTLWHPVKKLAGMCHVVLPEGVPASTRFADFAIKKFVEVVAECNTLPLDYEVGIYGGGSMFPSIKIEQKERIGLKNIKEIEKLLIAGGFHIKFKDVGGEVARKIMLGRLSGDILLEHINI